MKNATNTLEGKNILLSPLTSADDTELGIILNDKITMEALVPFFGKSVWTDEMIKDRYEEFRKRQREGTGLTWTVRLKPTNRIVGSCSFKNIDPNKKSAEFGIILHRSVWGTGLASESHLLALEFGFTVKGFQSVYFETLPHNLRMKGFFEKAGIPLVATEKESLRYQIDRSVWETSKMRLGK